MIYFCFFISKIVENRFSRIFRHFDILKCCLQKCGAAMKLYCYLNIPEHQLEEKHLIHRYIDYEVPLSIMA